jgi:AcrR family transcriptional regulator
MIQGRPPTPVRALVKDPDMMRSTTPPITTRDSILDAAGTLLIRCGYHKASMDDLASEAGVARRTLYLHFKSKDEIFLARIDRIVERLLADLRRIAAGPGTPSERLAAILFTRVLSRFDAVRGYTQCLDEIFQALRQPYLARREGYFSAEAAIVARVLEEGRAAGDCVFSDANETAKAMIAATSVLLPYSLSARELGSRAEVEALTKRITEMLIGGISRGGTRSGI